MGNVIEINGLKDLIKKCWVNYHYVAEGIFGLRMETADGVLVVRVKPTITSNGIEYLYEVNGKYLKFNDWLLELYQRKLKRYSERPSLSKEAEEIAYKTLEMLNNKLSKNRGDMIE